MRCDSGCYISRHAYRQYRRYLLSALPKEHQSAQVCTIVKYFHWTESIECYNACDMLNFDCIGFNSKLLKYNGARTVS